MSQLKIRSLIALFAVAALGIGLNLAYPGLGATSAEGSGCPFLSQTEASEKSGATGVCPYSGAGPDSQAKEDRFERPSVKPRDLRNVV